jgi:hypothetical protein
MKDIIINAINTNEMSLLSSNAKEILFFGIEDFPFNEETHTQLNILCERDELDVDDKALVVIAVKHLYS